MNVIFELEKRVKFGAIKFDDMIQRIQTLLLLLTLICALFLMTGSIMTFSGESDQLYSFGFKGLERFSGETRETIRFSVSLQMTLFLISILSAVAIFLYKKRKYQIVAALAVAAFSFCLMILIAFNYYKITTDYNIHIGSWFKMLIPAVMSVLSWMAYRRIAEDEKLVRSYDRLR